MVLRISGRRRLRHAVHDDVALVAHCAYFGDVSAVKFLLSRGATLAPLGENLGLNAASFHGHWRLCKFLLEQGAHVNDAEADTGETALHSALCTPNRLNHNLVLRVLVAAGADPNLATRTGIETRAFMRDCRTKGETPLHRAAAFGDDEAIQLLLDAGAKLDAKDVNATLLSPGQVGTLAPRQSSASSATAISASAPIANPCKPTSSANLSNSHRDF